MKTSFAILTIALSTLAAGTAARAADDSAQTNTQAIVQLAAADAAGTIKNVEEGYVPPMFESKSRAEVEADLAAWHKAGLDQEWRGEQTPDIYSTAYRYKYDYYQYLLAH